MMTQTEAQEQFGAKTDNEVVLPSGATMGVVSAPFADARALYKALLREMTGIKLDIDPKSLLSLNAYLVQALARGFASDEVENAIWKCMQRCVYNGQRITPATFEPVTARQDYMKCCTEVVWENVGPFGKNLFAEFLRVAESMKGFSQKPTSETSTTN